MKNKTVATWLAFLGGPLGLHRFYLRGIGDIWGWLYPLPSAFGLYGVIRAQQMGLDDHWSWVLIPLLGVTITAGALSALVYGLKTPEKWNTVYNPATDAEAVPGQSNWLTVVALVCALLVGTGTLMASLAFSFQRYFEYQIEVTPKDAP
jgi:hypothetical protein